MRVRHMMEQSLWQKMRDMTKRNLRSKMTHAVGYKVVLFINALSCSKDKHSVKSSLLSIHNAIASVLLCVFIIMNMNGSSKAGSYRIYSPPSQSIIDDEDVCTALCELGGSPDFVRITGYAQISSNFVVIEELEHMAESFANEYRPYILNVIINRESDTQSKIQSSISSKNQSSILCKTESNKRKVELSFETPDTKGIIMFSSIDKGADSVTFASVSIDVYLCNDSASQINTRNKDILSCYEKLSKIKDSLDAYFSNKYNGIIISTTYRAVFCEKFDQEEMEAAADCVMKRLGGYETDALNGLNFISRVGYSNRIKEGYKTENISNNLNVAARYNSYEDNSYVWVGIPIINAEY